MRETANQQLLDAFIRHQTYLVRYSGSVRNYTLGLVQETDRDVRRTVLDNLNEFDGIITPGAIRRLKAIFNEISTSRGKAWQRATDKLLEHLRELGEKEPLFTKALMMTTAPVMLAPSMPDTELLKTLVDRLPYNGSLVSEWMTSLAVQDMRRIQGAIQVGMAAGESSKDILRRIEIAGILTRRQTETLVRTSVQHVANEARDLFIHENADIITEELYVATLDARTTPICRSLDGKKFPIGKGPRPPMHFSCRSLRVPAFDGVMFGSRPYKASTTKQLLNEYTAEKGLSKASKREELPRGSRGAYDAWARTRVRQLTGTVPNPETYQTWLKKQTVTFQEDVLGVTKSKLFRDGGLTLDRFIAEDGSELTLSQLARSHAKVFRAVGLDPVAF